MSDADTAKCGPMNSSSVSSFGSCSSYQTTATYTPYPSSTTITYTPPPACPDGQYWSGSACVSYSTPAPTTDPSASCAQSGGTWTGSYCQYPTPIPAPESTPPPENPPPSSFDYQKHNLAVHDSAAHRVALANTIMACASTDGEWNTQTNTCQLGSRSFLANAFRFFIQLFK